VQTFSTAKDDERKYVLENLHELVVKPTEREWRIWLAGRAAFDGVATSGNSSANYGEPARLDCATDSGVVASPDVRR
jgi:uncharacterized circularly permuted ATP-grasp superfamily protein